MSHMDDIFDLRALVKKHGDSDDRQAWRRIESQYHGMAEQLEEWAKLSNSVDELADAVVAIAPKRVKAAIAKAKGK